MWTAVDMLGNVPEHKSLSLFIVVGQYLNSLQKPVKSFREHIWRITHTLAGIPVFYFQIYIYTL